jgi:hypothetical protein
MNEDDLATLLSAPLTAGQDAKNEAFSHLVDGQSALVQSLQLEQRRTVALHGSDSKHATMVQALLASRQEAANNTTTSATQASTPSPLADPQLFIVYGTVFNKAGAGMKDVDVSAATDKGNILLTTTTDTNGAYTLRLSSDSYQPPASAGTGRKKKSREETIVLEVARGVGEHVEGAEDLIEGEGGRENPASKQRTPPAPTTFHLLASDKKKTFLLTSDVTFEFQAGKLAYQDLTAPV